MKPIIMKSYIYISLLFLPILLCNKGEMQAKHTPLPHTGEAFSDTTELPSTTILNIEYLLIKAKSLGSNDFEFTLWNSQKKREKELKFSVRPFTYEGFYSAFKYNFLQLIKDSETNGEQTDSRLEKFRANSLDVTKDYLETMKSEPNSSTAEGTFQQEARRIFNFFIGSIRTIEDLSLEPKAGDLCYNSLIDIQRTITGSQSKLEKKHLNNDFKTKKLNGEFGTAFSNVLVYEKNGKEYLGKAAILRALQEEKQDKERADREQDLQEERKGLIKLKRELANIEKQKKSHETLANTYDELWDETFEKIDSLEQLYIKQKDSLEEVELLYSKLKLYEILGIDNEEAGKISATLIQDAITNNQTLKFTTVEANNQLNKDIIEEKRKQQLIISESKSEIEKIQLKISNDTKELDKINAEISLLEEKFKTIADSANLEKTENINQREEQENKANELNAQIENLRNDLSLKESKLAYEKNRNIRQNSGVNIQEIQKLDSILSVLNIAREKAALAERIKEDTLKNRKSYKNFERKEDDYLIKVKEEEDKVDKQEKLRLEKLGEIKQGVSLKVCQKSFV